MGDRVEVGSWTLLDDVAEVAWLQERLAGEGIVSALVPSMFEAYARVFHPAYDPAGTGIRWADIGCSLGREISADTQFSELAGVSGPDYPAGPVDPVTGESLWSSAPEQGTLPELTAATLAALLSRFIGKTTDCLFAVWEGFSDVAHLRPVTPARLRLPDRSYLVFSGPVGAAAESVSPIRFQTMNLWWPRPHPEWFLATDIDHISTYVGGSESCIAAILGDSSIETAPVEPNTSFLSTKS